MWPFKKKVIEQEAVAPREYYDYTVVLDTGQSDEFKSYKLITSEPYHNFYTPDGWKAYKINTVRFIECKKATESKVVPFNA